MEIIALNHRVIEQPACRLIIDILGLFGPFIPLFQVAIRKYGK
jgi:hypothetical protein